jgi:5-methyltetrahydrofolate--homocysteine methyltransferase
MAKYAIMARNSGAKIIGGCCGTKPEHLLSMRASLENENLGNSPLLEQVELEIGPFSSPFRKEIKRSASKRKRRKA